jgi:NAD(P)H-hydrate repair Nnr-like enzyme with NAD(P)H-hydrate dehydratase domain
VVSSSEGEPCFCREGNVGLATSGSGDVLAGVITGLLARGATPFVATCWGVYLHASSGDYSAQTIGPLGFLAREILNEIPRIMSELS